MFVYVLFFLSGVAGLIYQVIWVRQFGNVFGNTVYSATLVTAVFMLGLGLGSYFTGRWSDRRYRENPEDLVRLYALFELGIAALGMGIALLLPLLEPLAAAVGSYVPDERGWYCPSFLSQAFSYLLAFCLMAPITFLMGGTLTLLVRHLVRRDLSAAGWKVGVLYGLNTAGAALGAFAVDFALVPALGLLASQSMAALLNLSVALAALRWAAPRKRSPAPPADEPPPAAPAKREQPPQMLSILAGSAIFLSGLAAMGMEILWFRFMCTALGGYRSVFSLLLTVILVGIWLGATAGGAVQRKLGRPAGLYAATQGLFVAAALGAFLVFSRDLFFFPEHVNATVGAMPPQGRLAELWIQLLPILAMVGLPACLMGFAYPLANAVIQRAEGQVGQRAGMLYLANTLGAVSGSLLAGFVLVPGLGTQTSILLLGLVGLGASFPLIAAQWHKHRAEPTGRILLGIEAMALLAACAALLVWLGLEPKELLKTFHPPVQGNERAVLWSEGVNESILITEITKGPHREGLRLYTNGNSMSSTSYVAQRYMRAFAHIPLLQMENPRNVLVVCFGVGNTVHAASLHSQVESLEVVDLSRHIFAHAHFFEAWNHNVLDDSRVSVFVNDGRQHLRMQKPERYDLVTLEPPPINFAGVASLYSTEFYELVWSRLRTGGYFTQWLPAYQVTRPTVAAMVQAFISVFPDAVLLSGYDTELILLGRKARPLLLDPERVQASLRERSEVRADLERIDLGSLLEIVGTFAGSSAALAATAGDMPPVTDDLPQTEYSPLLVDQPGVTLRLFEPLRFERWCPACVRDAGPVEGLELIFYYMAFMQARYKLDAQMEQWAHTPGAKKFRVQYRLPTNREMARRTWEASGYMRRVFPDARDFTDGWTEDRPARPHSTLAPPADQQQ
ncbi:MAG: hypothetical protein JXR96_05305 [Deltaproteobacteria bacterium]|nr:hypothetical protein [Deltaproteobacteria bacterium]